MRISDRFAAIAFIVLIGGAHVWITYRLGQLDIDDGIGAGASCVLIWLAFWICYKADEANQRKHEPRWSADIWRTRGSFIERMCDPAVLADWREDSPYQPSWEHTVRRAIRSLGARRRARKLAQQRIDVLFKAQQEKVTINQYPDF